MARTETKITDVLEDEAEQQDDEDAAGDDADENPEETPEDSTDDACDVLDAESHDVCTTMGRIETAVDEDGDHHWILFSRNGKPLATNATSFARHNDMVRSLTLARKIFAAVPVLRQ